MKLEERWTSIMWNTRPIEQKIEKKLKIDFGRERGAELFANYVASRKVLVEEILPEIKAKLPSHSDHGPEHIANVLDNVDSLLGGEPQKYLTGVELYCLGLSILFHDAGNLYGREGHNKRISKIYDHCRSVSPEEQEKLVVLRVAEAHTGITRDGNYDTLKELSPLYNLFARPVRLREIAAILRFADELAEGPQRTSRFMHEIHGYDASSLLFHQYAKVTRVYIDRGNERIVLTYYFHLDFPGKTEEEALHELEKLILFTYDRITKLDQERRYVAFYSELLAPFKRTSAEFNFFKHGELIDDLELGAIEISDKIVPGEKMKSLHEYNAHYEINALLSRLRPMMERKSDA